MTIIDDLNKKVDDLSAQLVAADTKVDRLIAIALDLKILVDQGQGGEQITVAQVQAVIDKISAISTTAATQVAEEDAAITTLTATSSST